MRFTRHASRAGHIRAQESGVAHAQARSAACHADLNALSTAAPACILVTDAWFPQVNGVVHTWNYVRAECERLGHRVHVIDPAGSRGFTAPGEPDLLLSTEPRAHVLRGLRDALGTDAGAEAGASPASLHIATEGPLGWAARSIARARRWPFTTSYHTRFPEYLEARFRLPASLTYAIVRHFHAPSRAVLVATEAMRDTLAARGFKNLHVWSRGVDAERFKPQTFPNERRALDLPRPIFLSAGRVAPEKELESFLRLNLPGSKVAIGDGPALPRLQAKYPNVHWLGRVAHDALAPYYDAADVFVFHSRTDTFGLVMLEAMACGCPVAAFPVTGPIDVLTPGVDGVLDADLHAACMNALQLDRRRVRASAAARSWRAIAEQWLGLLVPIERMATAPVESSVPLGL